MLAFALNENKQPVVVSPIYEVFGVDIESLLPAYLSLWLSRNEFDRYARYNSWGSARENFTFEEMKRVRIPIPDISTQLAIANINAVCVERKRINEQLKKCIRKLCPILIKGSLEEARKEV